MKNIDGNHLFFDSEGKFILFQKPEGEKQTLDI